MPHFDIDGPGSRHIHPDDPDNSRRAILNLNLMAAADELNEDDFAVFDLVVMGGKTLKEAAAALGIPRMTADDRYQAALRGVRRRIRNDPGVQLLFEALMDLFEDRR
jgi:DNA-directed RNA polymerase specialized sigma24 family protein